MVQGQEAKTQGRLTSSTTGNATLGNSHPISAYLLTTARTPYGYVSFTGFSKDGPGTRLPLQSMEASGISYHLSDLRRKLAVVLGAGGLAACHADREEGQGRRRGRGPGTGETSLEHWLASMSAASATAHGTLYHTHNRGTEFFIKARDLWGVPAEVASADTILEQQPLPFPFPHVCERGPFQAAWSLHWECRSLEGTFQRAGATAWPHQRHWQMLRGTGHQQPRGGPLPARHGLLASGRIPRPEHDMCGETPKATTFLKASRAAKGSLVREKQLTAYS